MKQQQQHNTEILQSDCDHQDDTVMTGPIIPADKWPEWADRHCWDKNGTGWFYGPAKPSAFAWFPEFRNSDTPMPDGWDWRVPVMRQPAIDLGQFRETIERLWKASHVGSEDDLSLGKLLALIDGQAEQTGPAYRLLNDGEIVAAGDEILNDACTGWLKASGINIGMRHSAAVFMPVRRPI